MFGARDDTGVVGQRMVSQLLRELDALPQGGDPTRRVVVMAATNAPWAVDAALLRPGARARACRPALRG